MSEYKPTEYVVDFGDCRSNQFVRLNMALIEQNSAKLGERIVRCRDCTHYMTWANGYSFCSAFSIGATGDPFPGEPDGFCAWGERREP